MSCTLAGTISVKAALETRKMTIEKIIVNPKKRSRDIAYLIALARQAGIPVEFADGAVMNSLAAGNGGILAVSGGFSLPALDSSQPLSGLCVYIDGVEDPYNLGSIARTLYAAGAGCMILRTRDWSNALATLMRSSAGAWVRLPVYTVDTDLALLEAASFSGLPLICASRDEKARPLFDSPLPENCLLAIGGAMRGLSATILQAPGTHLYIPYGRPFRNALDSVGACSVFAFAWTQQHRFDPADPAVER